MIEFLRKFENRGIKFGRVNSIRIPKSINLQQFTLILYADGVSYDRRAFLVHNPFIEKYIFSEYAAFVFSYFSEQFYYYYYCYYYYYYKARCNS